MAILTRSFQDWNSHPPPLLEGVAVDGSQLSSSPGIALAKRSCLLLLGRNCLEGQVSWYESPTSIQTSLKGYPSSRAHVGDQGRLFLQPHFPLLHRASVAPLHCSCEHLSTKSPACKSQCLFPGNLTYNAHPWTSHWDVLDNSELIIEARDGVSLTTSHLPHCGKGLEWILRGNHTICYAIQHAEWCKRQMYNSTVQWLVHCRCWERKKAAPDIWK